MKLAVGDKVKITKSSTKAAVGRVGYVGMILDDGIVVVDCDDAGNASFSIIPGEDEWKKLPQRRKR